MFKKKNARILGVKQFGITARCALLVLFACNAQLRYIQGKRMLIRLILYAKYNEHSHQTTTTSL